jgi:DNA repair protein RadD
LYFCQVRELLDRGYLAKLLYFDMVEIDGKRLDMDNVKLNTTGADYDEKSLKEEYERADFYEYTLTIINRLLHPKDGKPRNGILVFTKFVEEAERLTWDLDGVCEMVSGATPMKEREAILERFKSGETKVVANVGVLTTGFDYPALDTIVLARPTMSLALYYQMVGRAIRPYPGKVGWVIDLCGTVSKFGEVADLEVDQEGANKWIIVGTKEKKQLTNIIMRK